MNKSYAQAQSASIHNLTSQALDANHDHLQRRLNASIRIQLARLGYAKATKADLKKIVLRSLEVEIHTQETV